MKNITLKDFEQLKGCSRAECCSALDITISKLKYFVARNQELKGFFKVGRRKGGPRVYIRKTSRRENPPENDNPFTENRRFECQCGCGKVFFREVSKGAGRLRFFSQFCRPKSAEKL